MRRRAFLASSLVAAPGPWCSGQESGARVRVLLDPRDPVRSFARVDGLKPFPVGFGKHGVLPRGERFRAGYSLLGNFRVNATLAEDRFEMTDDLVASSGKSREWLAEHLFANMSAIDFDGDGRGGEYGAAYIGLEPVGSDVEQPFHFGEYRGVFRWYSYAIHGTQDEERIGKCVTGGCVNVGKEDLEQLVERIRLGDLVEVVEAER